VENSSRVAEYEAQVEAKTKVMNDLLRPLTLATKEESSCSKNADAAKRFLKQAERELSDFHEHLRSRDVGSQKQLRLERIKAAQVDLDEAIAEHDQAKEAFVRVRSQCGGATHAKQPCC
jgi:chromosome segregation ATPase